MGWDPRELGRPQYLMLSTQGGIRAADGRPIALGYHTGHWEIGLLMQAAAQEIAALGGLPFAGFCSDPCDGRTQGTVGMMDSLAYRNDAAVVLRRLARSLPTRRGVLGVATCDKGLPAMTMALAALRDLPCVLVPGGVTLPPQEGEDAGTVQAIGARFAHGSSRSSAPPSWAAAPAARRAAAASSSAPRPPRRSWARPSVSPCRTARWRPPASRSGSTWRGARRAPSSPSTRAASRRPTW
jgi:dihydroxyacid dehydratase/phosphogluconate dehydratase